MIKIRPNILENSAEGDAKVFQLRIFRIVVDVLHLTIAIVVRKDEDDAYIVACIHNAKVEVSLVMDD